VEDNEWLSESESENKEVDAESPFTAHLKYLLTFIVIWQFAYTVSNAAITNLLRFLRYFLFFIGRTSQSEPISNIGSEMPLTLKSVRQILSLQEQDYTNYVVCPSCNLIYEYEDCVTVKATGEKISELCRHVQFPKHPQRFVELHVRLFC
jgi:hypothetical protein